MIQIKPNNNIITSISNALIVSVEDMGKWLNLAPSAITMQQDMLSELIVMATELVENYTWVNLRRKTIEAYYLLDCDCFCGLCNGFVELILNRSPLLSTDDITKIEYLSNNGWVEFDRGTMTISGLYENTTENIDIRNWGSIYFREPIEYQDRLNAYKVRVTYNSGFDPVDTTAAKIPTLYKMAIKKIAAFHYTNRGDCASECSISGVPVPCDVKGMLAQKAISKTVMGGEYAVC